MINANEKSKKETLIHFEYDEDFSFTIGKRIIDLEKYPVRDVVVFINEKFYRVRVSDVDYESVYVLDPKLASKRRVCLKLWKLLIVDKYGFPVREIIYGKDGPAIFFEIEFKNREITEKAWAINNLSQIVKEYEKVSKNEYSDWVEKGVLRQERVDGNYMIGRRAAERAADSDMG